MPPLRVSAPNGTATPLNRAAANGRAASPFLPGLTRKLIRLLCSQRRQCARPSQLRARCWGRERSRWSAVAVLIITSIAGLGSRRAEAGLYRRYGSVYDARVLQDRLSAESSKAFGYPMRQSAWMLVPRAVRRLHIKRFVVCWAAKVLITGAKSPVCR